MTELDILTALARAGCCQATSELITIMTTDIRFSQIQLGFVRQEAKEKGIELPKGLTALKSGVGDWFLVESRDGKISEEICAHNAFEAREKVLSRYIQKAEEIKAQYGGESMPRANTSSLSTGARNFY